MSFSDVEDADLNGGSIQDLSFYVEVEESEIERILKRPLKNILSIVNRYGSNMQKQKVAQARKIWNGTEKGIPTLVLAAASFDDVLSISAFGIALGSRSPQETTASRLTSSALRSRSWPD